MRVVIANKFAYVTGGVDRHCLLLAKALRERGHEVAFLSTASEQNVETFGRFVRCDVTHASRDDLSAARRARAAQRALWNAEGATAMHALISDFRPDVVHAHKLYPQLSVAPLVVASRQGLPVVQTLQDYEHLSASPLDDSGSSLDRDESQVAYRGLNMALHQVRQHVHRRTVTRWTACAAFVADLYQRRRGIHSTVVPNFVDAGSSVPTHDFAARNGVVFCGNLAPEKGVHDVLELARRAPRRQVTIIGDGDLAALVSKAASELPNLTYVGRVLPAALPEFLARARVVVIPSRWAEPGAVITLDAMLAGTPVVVYDSGGLTEYVEDAGGGIVVEPDADALVETVERLHDDEERWLRLSRDGATTMIERYSPDAFVRALEPIYAEAVEAKANP